MNRNTWLTVLAVLMVPFYALGWIIGFCAYPLVRGFLFGYVFIDNAEQERVNKEMIAQAKERGLV